MEALHSYDRRPTTIELIIKGAALKQKVVSVPTWIYKSYLNSEY